MASKYDFYWKGKLSDLKELLRFAKQQGESSPLDVSDIQSYGARGSWYGMVEVSGDGVKLGHMAHAKSLGNVIFKNGLIELYLGCTFCLAITSNCQLTAKLVKKATVRGESHDEREPFPRPSTVPDRTRPIPLPAPTNEQQLLNILMKIPWASWEQICKEEPEWQIMFPLMKKYPFGAFAVLMLVTGLNDYQLRGRAERAYWPPLGKILHESPHPSTPSELATLLEPFYRNERYSSDKVRRLHKFLSSRLGIMLWGLSANNISGIFPYIWRELAKTMNQSPEAKTISFAMKYLGLSLLMVGEHGFNFTEIPIPVDIRVVSFSKRAGLCVDDQADNIINIWNRILGFLQKCYPSLAMIHLDSLIWQIAALEDEELLRYFKRIGTPEAGNELVSLLSGKTINQSGIKCSQRNQPSSPSKVIYFIPCCSSKSPTGKIISPKQALYETRLPNTWASLLNGRTKMSYCIKPSSKATSTLYLYTGAFYDAFGDIKVTLGSDPFWEILEACLE